MASATMACASVVAAPVSAHNLSSSAAFGASQTQMAPIRNLNVRNSRVVAVTASHSEVSDEVLIVAIAMKCYGLGFCFMRVCDVVLMVQS